METPQDVIVSRYFSVPTFAEQVSKIGYLFIQQSCPLIDIREDELSTMCDEWRAAVFKAAHKADSKKIVQ